MQKNSCVMDDLKHYLVPYVLSNIIFALCIPGAIFRPLWTRIFLAAFFLWACCINSITAIRSPEVYLDYGNLTRVGIYRNFINGFFSRHIAQFIIPIAMGQLFIFFGLVLNKKWTRLACIGGILFGLAIAPLGVGSAFPATVSMAISFLILLRKYGHDFIWKWKQYGSAGWGHNRV